MDDLEGAVPNEVDEPGGAHGGSPAAIRLEDDDASPEACVLDEPALAAVDAGPGPTPGPLATPGPMSDEDDDESPTDHYEDEEDDPSSSSDGEAEAAEEAGSVRNE